LVTIVIDSIAGASTKQEMEAEFDKDGYATSKAIIISKAMRKITQLIARENILLIMTNQLRVKMGVSFGDPYTTSGGKAIGFHSSVRMRLHQMGKLKGKLPGDEKERVVGIKTKATIFKNRISPPHREVMFDIYFDSGIDKLSGLLIAMKELKIIKVAGSWMQFDDIKKYTETKFQASGWPAVYKQFERELYEEVCQRYIVKYKDMKFDPTTSEVTLESGTDLSE